MDNKIKDQKIQIVNGSIINLSPIDSDSSMLNLELYMQIFKGNKEEFIPIFAEYKVDNQMLSSLVKILPTVLVTAKIIPVVSKEGVSADIIDIQFSEASVSNKDALDYMNFNLAEEIICTAVESVNEALIETPNEDWNKVFFGLHSNFNSLFRQVKEIEIFEIHACYYLYEKVKRCINAVSKVVDTTDDSNLKNIFTVYLTSLNILEEGIIKIIFKLTSN